MESYLIRHRGLKFITGASTIMDAENKFVEVFDLGDNCDYEAEKVELTQELKNNDEIVFF